MSANGILHVDQIGRIVAVPTNGWTSRVTDVKLTENPDAATRNICLESSHLSFVAEKNVFVFTPDGYVYPIEIIVEGRAVVDIVISQPPVRITIPTVVTDVGNDHLFVGSTVGPSMLLKTVKTTVKKEDTTASTTVGPDPADADMDLDDGML